MKTLIIRGAGWTLMSILAPAAIAATFTVTNTNDSGAGSLRDAINQANGDPVSPVSIHFNVPPGPTGVAVIQPLTPLPIIQNLHGQGITIDGFTQPGSSVVAGNPSSLVVTVELDGSLVSIPAPPLFAHGLHIKSSGNKVQGLCVHSFPHDGISIQGSPLSVSGPSGANANYIQWNLVGTDVTGTIAMPNGHNTPPGLWGGIYVKVLPGMTGVANLNQILENVVSGNTIEGVGIANCPDLGSDVQQNHVERCLIGIDITGALPLGNGHDGVYIGEGAHDNVIEQNWIGANGYSGVGITGLKGLPTYGNYLLRNKIGVDVNLNPMPNKRHGVAIGSYGGTVWGFAPSNKIEDNIIAFNGLTGVAVQEEPNDPSDNDTGFNTITVNSIYQNGPVDPGYLGIDLIFEPGVTANDPGDVDPGPNELMNFPVISSAIHSAGTTTVTGTIDPPAYPVRIEVFTAMPGRDGSNHGQGAVFLGSTSAAGPAWNVALTGALPGQLITVTATDSAGNTSEFSLNAPVWDDNQQDVDFGDAPDQPYPTLKANGGPGHQIVPGMYLGYSVDGEADGQPDPTATGDDNDGNDDGDGVTFPVPLVPGQPAQIDVVASMQGRLDAWIDFDLNGTWSPTEQILASSIHPGGGMLMSYAFNVPPNAVVGNTFARIRYSSGGGLLPSGSIAPDGEIEDHMVAIQQEPPKDFDWGDAPDPSYPTLAVNNGAHHQIVPGIHLGNSVDAETDGQPHPFAAGDDNAMPPGTDDEDGVIFLSPIVIGGTVTVQVTASVPGDFYGWIDFNRNGSWADAGEMVFAPVNIPAGVNHLSFPVPANAAPGTTFTRFRFTSVAGLALGFTGPAPDGEVEDYILEIEDGSIDHKMHWAQLPDPNGWDVRGFVPKILADDFRCTESGPITRITFWGSWREDKVGEIFNVHLSIHEDDRSGEFSKPGKLLWETDTAGGLVKFLPDPEPELGDQGWYDPNTGLWVRPDHQQYYEYTVVIPENEAFVQEEGKIYWLDIQVTCEGGQWGWKTSRAAHFEDDAVWDDTPQDPPEWRELVDPIEQLSLDLAFVIGREEEEPLLDFGDAPPPYPTLAANNGARHVLGGPLWLGAVVDPEPDGQPDPAALGDDLNLIYPGVPDDEDGVSFGYALIGGKSSMMQVIASAPGFIDVWIDWNGNGSWGDPSDIVLSGYPVNPGANYVMITVPPVTFTGQTKARIRISSTGFLPPTGLANDGEVEDHEVFLYEEGGMDFGDAPNSGISPTTLYETTMMDFGAAHFIDSVLFLGMLIDSETDGQPGILADGDDLNPPAGPTDEEGVNFASPWISGVAAQVIVMVNPAAPGPFYDLDLWVDWNTDGTWAQANDHVLAAIPVVPGPNLITIPVPSGLGPRWVYARFRLTHPGTGVGYTGYVFGGEVEDYRIPIGQRIQASIAVNTSTSPPQVVLTWPAISGATSYSIYSSTNLGSGFPNPPNWTLETTTASLTWSDPITVPRKFYIVVAFP